MLKANLLRLAIGPLVVLVLLGALALGGHAASPVRVAPAHPLLACGGWSFPPCE